MVSSFCFFILFAVTRLQGMLQAQHEVCPVEAMIFVMDYLF